MDHKIGDLVVDFDIKSNTEKNIFDTEPKDITVQHTFGIIVGTSPIDPNDEYYKLYLDNFTDGISYSILWADYEKPIEKYSTEHITYFKKELLEIEREMDEKDKSKQENK